jgi:plastocyanin
MSGPRILRILLLVGMGGPLGCTPMWRAMAGPPPTGEVHGRVSVPGGDVPLAELSPIVVYLDPVEADEDDRPPEEAVTIGQRGGAFWPSFFAMAAGQTVAFHNGEQIYHRIFSYSEPNTFDLGAEPQGEASSVTLLHPGVVHVYCSLHPWEAWAIFVSPSRYFATVGPSGRYEIRGVPPGRYRILTWAERVPSVARAVTVRAGQSVSVDVAIAGGGESM